MCLSTEDLNTARELAALIVLGSEFQRRMELGKKECRWQSMLERGMK